MTKISLAALVGTLSIGTGGHASRGLLNLSQPGIDRDASTAFKSALADLARAGGGVLQLLGGVYKFNSAVTVPDNVAIVGSRGTILDVGLNNGSTGFFNLSGDNCLISGVTFRGGCFPGQKWLNVSGAGNTIEDCLFEATSAGNNSSPTVGIYSANAFALSIESNDFLPAKGYSAIEVNQVSPSVPDASGRQDAPLIRIHNNRIRTDSPKGFGGSDPLSYRLCYGGIRVSGNGWIQVMGNILWGLGSAANKMNHGILLEIGVNPSGTETGHLDCQNNMIEQCALDRHVQVWGAPSGKILGNTLGFNQHDGGSNGIATTVGSAAIFVSGPGGNPLFFGGTAYPASLLIANNDIHNVCGNENASGIFVDSGSYINVRNNQLTVINNDGRGIYFAKSTALSFHRSCVIEGNFIASGTWNYADGAIEVFRTAPGVGSTVLEGIVIRNNSTVYFANPKYVPTSAVDGSTVVDSGNGGID